MILFLLFTFFFAPLAHPLNLSFRRNSGWEVSQPFSQTFAAVLQILGLSGIILSPLTSLHGIRLISYYYCPGKSYTLRRRDILTFITIFCDLKCFPPCFLSKMLFSHCIGFTWMFQLLSPSSVLSLSAASLWDIFAIWKQLYELVYVLILPV